MRKKIPDGYVDVVDPETGELTGEQLDLVEVLNAKGKRQDDMGREIPDPTPMAPPLGFKKQKPLHEQIRDMVRSEALAQAAASAGAETFEEADDFNVGDDYDPRSPWEEQFDPVPVSELKARRRAADAAEAAKPYRGGDAPPPPPAPLGEPSNASDGPSDE